MTALRPTGGADVVFTPGMAVSVHAHIEALSAALASPPANRGSDFGIQVSGQSELPPALPVSISPVTWTSQRRQTLCAIASRTPESNRNIRA